MPGRRPRRGAARTVNRAPHFSLWLALPAAARERFQALIARLAARLDTPVFPPHVTLLGGLSGEEPDLCRRAARLARELQPFDVRLLGLAWRDEYYRCLFVEVAPSRALRDAFDAAQGVFGRREPGAFYPHLSLVYGDLGEPEKQTVADDIGGYFDETLRIRELVLYDTSGPPPAWRCVERHSLGGVS